jgi:hypothetical protein
MGAPASPILSEVYLQFLENTIIYGILQNSKIEGYFRYVDDILLNYNEKSTNIQEVLSSFNNITPDMNFTTEIEQDNKLNFLDITISKTANKLSFNIYRKHTTSDNIILNDSCQPPNKK